MSVLVYTESWEGSFRKSTYEAVSYASETAKILETDVIANYTHILINEGQFFEDIYKTTMILVEKFKKHVTICGLDGDFKRVKFGKILDLIPFCDKVVKLSALCDCGHPAIFSHRITNETSQIVIGSSNYKPLCRKCYNQHNLV